MAVKGWTYTALMIYANLVMFAVTPAMSAGKTPTPASVASQWMWVTQNWTGNEAPYQKLRAAIDGSKSSGRLTLQTIERYKALHEKKPDDAAALYGWSYASFQATQSNPSVLQRQVVAPSVFNEAASPHTYEYDRLRFLVWAHHTPDAHLQEIGERLLRHSPDDEDVKYYLVQCYKPWRSNLEKQKAISLAQDLTRTAPSRPGSYSALGGVYFNSWMISHRKEDADKAISAYQDYLRIAPQNYAWRQRAKEIIRYISSRSRSEK